MQIQAREEKSGELIKLGELADAINNEFRQSNTLAVDAIKTSGAAVKAAIRTGQLLAKAKRIVGHGGWLKWLSDNCPSIDERTARNWMTLSKRKNVSDLTNAKNITAAYRAVGMLPEPSAEKKGIGTAPVDIFARLFLRFDKGLGPVIEIAADIDPQDMPPEQRHALLEKAQPMVEFIDRVKALEGV